MEEVAGMTWAGIESALTNVWGVVESCITFITGNAALMALFVAGLVPIGFKIFRKAKKSVK